MGFQVIDFNLEPYYPTEENASLLILPFKSSVEKMVDL